MSDPQFELQSGHEQPALPLAAACACPACRGVTVEFIGEGTPGVLQPNGKLSLSINDAALRLTRSGGSWSGAPGQGTVVTYSFQSTQPSTLPTDVSDFLRF